MKLLPFTYAVRNLFRDPARLLQTVGGSALVVFLLMAALAVTGGMDEVLSSSGSDKNVILLGKGSEESVERSEVHLDAEAAAATGVRGLSEVMGTAAVSGEITYMAPLGLGEAGKKQALLRGVREESLLVHQRVRLLQGSFPGPGQVMVGRLAARNLGVEDAQLEPGREVEFEGQSFTISGVFAAPGTVLESEVWFDRNDLASLTQRDSLSAVYVRFDRATDLEDAEVFALQRNDLELAAIPEKTYYQKLSGFYAPIKVMTWVTAGLVAAGAFFGGLNTLYAAFASRVREMGTLQAIGFSRKALLVSLVSESLLATLTGTLVALVLAFFLLKGLTVPFSVGTFTLKLTPIVVGAALATGLFLGTVGTLPAALRTLSPSLPSALRSS